MESRQQRRAAERRAAKKVRKDGSSNIERGESSNPEGGSRQGNETSEQRLARLRREGTQNLMTVRENQRANETPQQQVERIERERAQFLQEQASHVDDREAFATQWIDSYVSREHQKRGLDVKNYLSFNKEQIEEYCKPFLESELITEGMQTTRLDKLVHSVSEGIAFENTVVELNEIPPPQTSDNWAKFCSEKYDDIVDKYKLDRTEHRMQMLADAMLFESNNRSSPEQLKSKEYKTIVALALREWEAWKRDNNVTE